MTASQSIAATRQGLAAEIASASPGLGVTQLVVAHVYGVPLDTLMAATRKNRRAAEARQVSMYLAHVVLHMSHRQIARGFGRDRTTARYACRQIEELREDPELDRLVTWLEALLRERGLDRRRDGVGAMTSRLCEAQLAREARRIFRKLVAPGAYIVACAEGDDFALFVSRARAQAQLYDRGRHRCAPSWRMIGCAHAAPCPKVGG